MFGDVTFYWLPNTPKNTFVASRVFQKSSNNIAVLITKTAYI